MPNFKGKEDMFRMVTTRNFTHQGYCFDFTPGRTISPPLRDDRAIEHTTSNSSIPSLVVHMHEVLNIVKYFTNIP